MMDENVYNAYVHLLKSELVPAMGCTEPIAVAYAAASAARQLGTLPEKVDICVSANIIKNVKSVIVPNTGGLHGLEAAAAAGIIAGNPEYELLVISKVTKAQQKEIAEYLHKAEFQVRESDSGALFDIVITLTGGGHESVCRIAEDHTNIVLIKRDGKTVYSRSPDKSTPETAAHKELLSVEQIVAFADTLNPADVQEIFDRQIKCNMAIAEEGLKNNYGARIGQVLLNNRENDVVTRAKAYAAAASDARMGGCEKPVVINSGSGNQGITASVPVVIYSRELGASDEQLYRALAGYPAPQERYRSSQCVLRRDQRGMRCGSRNYLPVRRQVPRGCAHDRKRHCHQFRCYLRRCKGKLCSKDSVGGGSRHSRNADVQRRKSVFGR